MPVAFALILPRDAAGWKRGAFLSAVPSLHIVEHNFYCTWVDTPDLVPAAGFQETGQAIAKIIEEVGAVGVSEIRGDRYPQE